MALRAVPDHPKFAELMAVLNLSKYAALGILEAVWHFTGRYAPQGNIGKYSDQAIEMWVGWDGRPSAMVEALVGCRWLDRDSVHRLLVHDWAQHADKATKNALGRAELPFCTATGVAHIASRRLAHRIFKLGLPHMQAVRRYRLDYIGIEANGLQRLPNVVSFWLRKLLPSFSGISTMDDRFLGGLIYFRCRFLYHSAELGHIFRVHDRVHVADNLPNRRRIGFRRTHLVAPRGPCRIIYGFGSFLRRFDTLLQSSRG